EVCPRMWRGVGGWVPGVGLGRGMQQMRDTAVDPHRSDVVGPGLVEVAPVDTAVLMEDPIERRTGRRGADALGRVARHLGPGYLPTCRDIRVLCRVTREIRQQPRSHC